MTQCFFFTTRNGVCLQHTSRQKAVVFVNNTQWSLFTTCSVFVYNTQTTSSGVCLQHAVVCVYYAQCVRLQHTRRHKAVVFVKNTQRCLFTTSSGVCLHPPVMCIYGQCT
eukprot:GHVS01065213.1.p2 GENE.GHVS01065213.1~~GHVS01065213.1.p2  ORF type:complete len:110 (+),score=17.63 GHVS01065213.1:1331-1660(+)